MRVDITVYVPNSPSEAVVYKAAAVSAYASKGFDIVIPNGFIDPPNPFIYFVFMSIAFAGYNTASSKSLSFSHTGLTCGLL
jgi:hypothetical protein